MADPIQFLGHELEPHLVKEIGRAAKRKLTPAKIETLSKPGFYGDGGNLWLQVAPGRGRSWVFRYMLEGKAKVMGLGALGDVALTEARARALICRRLLRDGVDPLQERDRFQAEIRLQRRAELKAKVTIQEAFDSYVATHRQADVGRRPPHRWGYATQKDVLKVHGQVPVADIGDETIADICRATVHDATNHMSLPWSDLPAGFRHDAERYLDRGANPDILSNNYQEPVRPGTTENRKKQIRQFASALLLSGFDPDELTGLDVLTKPINVTRALRFLLDRNGNDETSPHLQNMCKLMADIAAHWVNAPKSDVETLNGIAGRFGKKKEKGMKSKNRERLRQFDLKQNRATLLLLPAKIFADLEKKDEIGKSDAVRAMYAVTLELLLMAPMRRVNATPPNPK